MSQVRLGIVGVGNMGSIHCRSILDGKIARLRLAAICDTQPAKLAAFPGVPTYADSAEMLRSGKLDAVLIATPHYSHTTLGADALAAGLHVLVEKPLSVHPADVQRLLAAYRGREKRQVFAAMFNQRTDKYYQKIRELLRSGELGAVKRIQWTITNWFRTQAYYDSGGWRATWAGEGGGVLLNQCPHNLDLFQWMFGMPRRVRAFCQVGRYHDIEVEDNVTAYLEYPDGATATFITSTGEAPGTNRLEVATERGRLVYEADRLLWQRTEVPVSEFCRSSREAFGVPPQWSVEIPCAGHGGQHVEILKNFVDAILDGAPLISPAPEGAASVELACAMLYSSFQGKTVELPLDARAYERHLKKLVAESARSGRKKTVREAKADMSASFR